MPRSSVAAKRIEPEPEGRSGPTREQAEDTALLARIAVSDGEAFRTLVSRYLPGVLAISRRMLRDDAEAEDIAQEAMLRLWRSSATLALGPGGLGPWLRRVASNLCIDRVRSGRRVSVVEEVPETPEEPTQLSNLEESEMAQRVDGALKALPERQRLALTLFHYEGLSQVEVGAAMGISDEAVESLLARARRNLKTTLANEWRQLAAGHES